MNKTEKETIQQAIDILDKLMGDAPNREIADACNLLSGLLEE